MRTPIAKGVLSPDQISLSPKQRDRYNQLVQQGIEPKVARQLAIALTKSWVAKGNKPLGAAFARARRLAREKGGDKEDEKRRVNEYLRDAGHEPIGKGGPGSGPSGDASSKEALARVKERVAQARADGDHKRADAMMAKVNALTQAAMGAARKSLVAKGYSSNFVAGAKEALPKAYFDQLHTTARARAGGVASGMKRRASTDEDKAALLEQRKALKAQLQQVEAELAKSAPLAQEVSVDAPVKIAPKEKKKRKALAEQIAEQAMKAAKSAPPKGKERVDFQVPARLLKTATPDWKRIVHSVVYAPGDIDAHGDYMSAEDIEQMAHDAMRSGIYVNSEHAGGAIEADIVESYIAPQDFELTLKSGEPYRIPKGSFIQAMHVWGDEPWEKVLKGEYVGYSLEGTALRDIA